MTSKHTPGPWFVQPGFLTIYNMDGGDYGLTCAVASVLDKQPGRDAAEANARLIAAAPKLLSLVKQFMAVGSGWDIQRNANDRRDLEDEARALVAEIEGQS